MQEQIIIQENLWDRGREVFERSNFRFFRFTVTEKDDMIRVHQQDGVRCFIIGAEAYGEEFFKSVQPNSIIIRFGVGYDNIPLDLCLSRSIMVANTPRTLDESVAEHTLALILSAAKNVPLVDSGIKSGGWHVRENIELKNKTLAIIGYGRIGQIVAGMAKRGFGMRIHAFGRTGNQPLSGYVDLWSSDFGQVVKDADFVSLHLTVNKDTEDFVDMRKLKLMSRKAILINTARGRLIQEDDLFDALTGDVIAGAALDVFTREPYEPIGEKDLRQLRNVILSSHISSNTDKANERMSRSCLRNAEYFFQSKFNKIDLVC